MSFFSDGFTKDKLMVMYFLERIQIELTREQMTTALSGFIQYFELQSAVNELEEEALLASIPRAYGQSFCLTEHGKSTLSMFEERIPQSVRDDLLIHAEKCREKLLNDKQFTCNIEKAPGGACEVTLKILEQNGELLSLKLMLPDVQSANHAAAVWDEKAESIYGALVGELFE